MSGRIWAHSSDSGPTWWPGVKGEDGNYPSEVTSQRGWGASPPPSEPKVSQWHRACLVDAVGFRELDKRLRAVP